MKVKIWWFAVMSKLHSRKWGFAPCKHMCASCEYKRSCAKIYLSHKIGESIFAKRCYYSNNPPSIFYSDTDSVNTYNEMMGKIHK